MAGFEVITEDGTKARRPRPRPDRWRSVGQVSHSYQPNLQIPSGVPYFGPSNPRQLHCCGLATAGGVSVWSLPMFFNHVVAPPAKGRRLSSAGIDLTGATAHIVNAANAEIAKLRAHEVATDLMSLSVI